MYLICSINITSKEVFIGLESDLILVPNKIWEEGIEKNLIN